MKTRVEVEGDADRGVPELLAGDPWVDAATEHQGRRGLPQVMVMNFARWP
jgi:hypothetical protein